MPQFPGPSNQLLKGLGFKPYQTDFVPTLEQLQVWRQIQEEEAKKRPLWKQKLDVPIMGLTGMAEGLLGLNPDPEGFTSADLSKLDPVSRARRTANYSTQLLQQLDPLAKAGLPFLAITKGKPVFHGTQKLFEKFDPSKYDTSDVMGWMTHFAENPEYASRGYAGGFTKGQKAISLNPADLPVTSKELEYTHHPSSLSAPTIRKSISPRMIPAHIQAQNVLDLVDPNIDDLAQAIANSPNKEAYIRWFKDTRRNLREGTKTQSDYLYGSHYPDPENIPINEVPMRRLAEHLRLGPGELEKTPFDAIRYRDVLEKSWAVPKSTPITTPWGTPLTEEVRPLKIFRTDKPSGGLLKVSEDRWQNTPLSLPEVPKPEKMKLGSMSQSYGKYTEPEIMSMYNNNVISSKEKNELLKHIKKPGTDKYVAFKVTKGSKPEPKFFDDITKVIDFVNQNQAEYDWLPYNEFLKAGYHIP